MFVSLRVGVFFRVVVVAAAVAAILVLLLTARTSPSPAPPDEGNNPESVQATDRPAGPARYYVAGTHGDGLNVRACSGTTCARVGRLPEGALFIATCWEHGPPVAGDRRWLAGSVDGRQVFASAHYLRQAGTDAARPCVKPVVNS